MLMRDAHAPFDLAARCLLRFRRIFQPLTPLDRGSRPPKALDEFSALLWHAAGMPGYYKWPAYVGNALLFLSGLIIASKNSLLGGAFVVGLSLLNLYLVWKLDMFSREEAWLALEIKKAKMREELLELQRKLAEEDNAAPPPEISGSQSSKP
jgi:hypothetical protein